VQERRWITGLAVFAALSVPAWCATVDVTVGPGLTFTPSSVTIAPGDTVQWTFTAPHTSTSDSSSGAEVWDSGIRFSGTFSHTFSAVGDWPYYCFLHSVPGGTAMNGVVHVAAAGPTISSVNPTGGSTAGGTSVTVIGTNFVSGCGVLFGTVPAASTVVNGPTTITATTAPHASGVVDVTVNCASGTATLPNAFTFQPPPAITNVQPSPAAPLVQVTITGSNFQNGATVTFGGNPSSSVTFVDSATLRAIVPNAAAGPTTVTVMNPDGQTATFSGFVILGITAVPTLSMHALLLLLVALAAVGGFALRGRL